MFAKSMFSNDKLEIIHIVKTKGDNADLKATLVKKEKAFFTSGV